MFERYKKYALFLSLSGAIFFAPMLAPEQMAAHAQAGNSISGFVFGVNRIPMSDVIVELLDDFGRTLSRSRTNGAGRYSFTGLSASKFRVRISPFGTDYEEQEQEIEIVSFASAGSSGTRLAGSTSEQRDFFLRLRKGVDPAAAGIVFAQSVPGEAKKLYELGLTQLGDKKDAEGLASLRSAIEIFPQYFNALERLGSEYVRLGHYEAAKIILTHAVAENARSSKSWYGLAYSSYQLKDYEEASKALDKLMAISSNLPEGLLLSGVVLRQKKQYNDAEKQLIKARDLAKDSMPQIHWELALLYGNNLKRYADAAKELRIYLKLQPDLQDAENIKKLIETFEKKSTSE
jgi:tetratricopeptide (TPR) repeat protein